jgi:hypothetical protein
LENSFLFQIKIIALEPQNEILCCLFGFNLSEYTTPTTTNSTSFNMHFPISNGL